MANFKPQQSYLVQKAGNVHKVKILQVTQTSYYFQLENHSQPKWETIERFETEFLLLEDLGAIDKMGTDRYVI